MAEARQKGIVIDVPFDVSDWADRPRLIEPEELTAAERKHAEAALVAKSQGRAHGRAETVQPESKGALTQEQLTSAIAERADLSKADARRAIAALEEIVLEQIGNAEKVRIGGLVQLTVRVKPATKKRRGRNPATGEEITIAAKPAAVDIRARPLARAKAALPPAQKLRRRIAS